MSTSETVKNAARELYADLPTGEIVRQGLDNVDRLARLAERSAIVDYLNRVGFHEIASWIRAGKHKDS